MTITTTRQRPVKHPVVFTSEAELIQILLRRVRLEWPTRALAAEVRSHGRCRADVCVRIRDMYEPIGNDLLVGIEAKLTDWNRALRQAALNRYAVDASMIALPIDRISEAMLSAADEYGVGVLGIHGRGLTVALPATVSCPDAALHARVITQLKPVKARGRVRVNEIVKGIERP